MTDISKVVSDGADQINDQLNRLVTTIKGGGNVGAKLDLGNLPASTPEQRATESTGPTIRAVSWVDGHGREQLLVPKAELDAANERIRELTIDRDETERERVKAVEQERATAQLRDRYRRDLPDGWFRFMECDFAQDRGFPGNPADGQKHRAKDGSLWHFDEGVNNWEIHEYAPEDVAALMREPDSLAAELSGISGHLPRPEATDPAHLRFAATIIEQTEVPKDHGGDGDDQERTARQLRDEADRIEERPSLKSVTIATPTIDHLGPRDTVASTYRRAAWNLRNGYDAGGSNMRESIATTLDRVADALTEVSG